MDRKAPLKILFGFVFVSMIATTILASRDVPLWKASFSGNPWAWATLWDAYFGFLTFYVWVLYKEARWGARVVWLVLIMTLGNIAMSLYVLIELFRLKPSDPAEKALWRRS